MILIVSSFLFLQTAHLSFEKVTPGRDKSRKFINQAENENILWPSSKDSSVCSRYIVDG